VWRKAKPSYAENLFHRFSLAQPTSETLLAYWVQEHNTNQSKEARVRVRVRVRECAAPSVVVPTSFRTCIFTC
jgi:hypothetical protein